MAGDGVQATDLKRVGKAVPKVYVHKDGKTIMIPAEKKDEYMAKGYKLSSLRAEGVMSSYGQYLEMEFKRQNKYKDIGDFEASPEFQALIQQHPVFKDKEQTEDDTSNEDQTTNDVKAILDKHGIKSTDDIEYGSDAFSDLFDYFSSDPDEMPYGVQKARTGMPDEWIANRLIDLGLLDEDQSGKEGFEYPEGGKYGYKAERGSGTGAMGTMQVNVTIHDRETDETMYIKDMNYLELEKGDEQETLAMIWDENRDLIQKESAVQEDLDYRSEDILNKAGFDPADIDTYMKVFNDHGDTSDLDQMNMKEKVGLAEVMSIVLASHGIQNESYQPFPEGDEFDIEEDEDFEEVLGPLGFPEDETELFDAEYRGRKVPLNKPMRGDVKKFKVYVKDPKTGNVKKVNFGHGGSSAKRKTMRIRKSNPKARKSFRARHNCANPGPKTKARYWSCRKW